MSGPDRALSGRHHAASIVVLGFLLLREWPLSGLWAIGTLVGANLILTGFSIISVGSAVRGVANRLAA